MSANPHLTINFNSHDYRARILAVEAYTPFYYGNTLIHSMASAVEGIKFQEKNLRTKVFRMPGSKAIEYAHKRLPNDTLSHVTWNQRHPISFNSVEHRALLMQFLGAKIQQNEIVRDALIHTAGFTLQIDNALSKSNTSLPADIVIATLEHWRDMLVRLNNL